MSTYATWWADDAGAPTPSPETRYRLDAELGRGGMGRVLLAWDHLLEREVAIKEVLPGAPEHLVARFLAEARLTAGLQHPSIVPVHDAGQRTDGTLFYVMKRIRGETLQDVLARTAGTARLRLVDRLVAVTQAVAHAHAAGILHRDLKPGNIMIGERGETLVVDWGLAIVAAHARGGLVGTPGYASPEQARGEALDARSDVWSLGAILYELLIGAEPAGRPDPAAATVSRNSAHPPFMGDDPLEIFARTGREPVAPLLTVAPHAPRPLAAIADRALAFEVDKRYASADALLADLEAWRDGERVSAYEYSAGEALSLLVRRWRIPLATLAVGLAVALVVAMVGVLRVREEQAETATTLARSLVQQGLAADQDGDAVGATAFALAALQIEESALARGLLMRHWGTFPLTTRSERARVCTHVSASACVEGQGASATLRALSGEWSFPAADIQALDEGAGRILVATPTTVVRLTERGVAETRWEGTPTLIAQHPTDPTRSAWTELRTLHRSDVPAPVVSASAVTAMAWSGDRLLTANRPGDVASYGSDGTLSPLCSVSSGISRGAFGPTQADGGVRMAFLGYDGLVRLATVDPNAGVDTTECRIDITMDVPRQILDFYWSKDGHWVAGTSATGEVHVWDDRGLEVMRVPGSVQFTPSVSPLDDGFRVATATVIRDYRAGDHRFAGTFGTKTLGFDQAEDGRLLLAQRDERVDLLAADGALVRSIPVPGVRDVLFSGETFWAFNRAVSRYALTGEKLEERADLGSGIQPDASGHRTLFIGLRELVLLEEPGWHQAFDADIRQVTTSRWGWIVRTSDGTWYEVSTDGRVSTPAVPPGTDDIARSVTGSFLTRAGRVVHIDGRALPELELEPATTRWIDATRILFVGPTESHIHDDTGACLAIRRPPGRRVWDASVRGDELLALTWDQTLEAWDLGALALDPAAAAAELADTLGVRVDGSELVTERR